jgi:asparagine synthase (glutamine-hydrolysing)
MEKVVQWIAGYVSRGKSASTWHPSGAAALHGMWLTGYDDTYHVRECHSEGISVVYAGHCFATDEELHASLADAQRNAWYELQAFPGVYVVIVRKGDTTIVIPSPVGTSRVYYVNDPEQGIWWSTASTPLAALIGSNVDLNCLLVDMAVEGIEPLAGRSTYDAVTLVPPGSFLSLTQASPTIHPLHATPSSPPSFTDAAAALKEALQRSIWARVRIGGGFASDLSGGLDSSTLALLTAVHVPVLGLTYADPWMGTVSDDMTYARRLADTTPDLTQQVVMGDKKAVHYVGLSEPDALPVTDLPSPDVMMTGYNIAKLTYAAERGVQNYLNGVAGDQVLLASPGAVVDLYRAGRRSVAIQRAFTASRRATTYPLPIITSMRRAARQTYAQDLELLATELLAGQTRPDEQLFWVRGMPVANSLTADGKRIVANSLHEFATTTSQPVSLGALHDAQTVRRVTIGRAVTTTLAQERGILLHMPFLDTKVVEACLSLPSYERSWPGSYKPLLGAAMRGVLPQFLLDRTTKGSFSGTMYQGIRQNRVHLERLIRNSRLAAAGLLDITQTLEHLNRGAAGIPTTLSTVSNLVMMEVWLQKLDLRREHWWTQQ